MSRLRTLLAPSSIAVLGGHWAERIVEGNRALGFAGSVHRIHPARDGCYRSIAALPQPPDVTFVGVAAEAVPGIARELRARGGAGFVCFASGFEEAENQLLTAELLEAAGEMPFFGTNCYGFINYLDGVALWPDTVIPGRPKCGVAIITQSGALAHGAALSQRSLPIGYLISVGNQTSIGVEDLILELSQDERVTAIGLYLEGVRDLERFRTAAVTAHRAGKPIALIKAGRTDWSRQAALCHTGAATGDERAFDRLCSETGIARCETLAVLLETLKLLHMGGPLSGNRVMAIAASGGYAIMTADAARTLPLNFAPLPARTRVRLTEILGPRIVPSNPFDFQTLHWHDPARMRAMFQALFEAEYDAIAFMFGYPPPSCADTSTYDIAIDEYIELAGRYRTRATVLAPLPEFCTARLRDKCVAGGVVPLQGHWEGLQALSVAAGGAAVARRREQRDSHVNGRASRAGSIATP